MADTFRHDVVLDRHFNVMAVVDYSILTQRLKNENLVHVQTSLAEYFRFLELKIRTSDWNATLLSPSAIVDRVWHLHILDTVRYAEECKRLCGHVIDHNPDGASDGSDRDARYQRTLDHYQIVFRMTPHSEIWPKLQGVAAPARNRRASARTSERSRRTRCAYSLPQRQGGKPFYSFRWMLPSPAARKPFTRPKVRPSISCVSYIKGNSSKTAGRSKTME